MSRLDALYTPKQIDILKILQSVIGLCLSIMVPNVQENNIEQRFVLDEFNIF